MASHHHAFHISFGAFDHEAVQMGELGNFLIVRPVFFYLWTVSLCILGKPWRFGRVLRDIFLIDLERNREPSLNESRLL